MVASRSSPAPRYNGGPHGALRDRTSAAAGNAGISPLRRYERIPESISAELRCKRAGHDTNAGIEGGRASSISWVAPVGFKRRVRVRCVDY